MYIIIKLHYLEELLQYCLSAGILKRRKKKVVGLHFIISFSNAVKM